MFTWTRMTCLVLAIVVLLGVGGCGVSGGGAVISGSSGATPTQRGTTADATAVVTPAPTPTIPGSVPGTTGSVTLAVNQTHFAPGGSIVVHIDNGAPTTIYAANHRTACTIVTLERNIGGSWQPFARCAEGVMTIMVPIRAGHQLDVTLASSGSQFASNLWPAGTYRAALFYSLAPVASGGTTNPSAPNVSYSNTFTVA